MMTTSNEHNNAPAVPQGWKLVPVEPTEAMSIAGGIAWESSLADDVIGPLEDAWAAMLAATPAPAPAQERCHLCDCTGDIHDATGEWRGECPYCKPAQEDELTDEEIEALPVWSRFVGLWPETRKDITCAIIAALRAKGSK